MNTWQWVSGGVLVQAFLVVISEVELYINIVIRHQLWMALIKTKVIVVVD